MAAEVDRDEGVERLRKRLAELQLAQVVHRRRAIVLIEGLKGSAKKAALKAIAGALDPCHFSVDCTTFDRRESADGHWLARYWRALPAAGHTAIFFRGWYHRVIEDRIAGRIDDAAAARAFDEINEFEAQQRDAGTLLVKLFFTVDPAVQQQRLAERSASRWHRMSPGETAIAADSPVFRTAFDDLVAHTDTRWSPWVMIDGSDERDAAQAALAALVGAWGEAMPADPPHLVRSAHRAA